MPTFDFNSTTSVKSPTNSSSYTASSIDLRGLDLTTPVDMLNDGHTPYAKNFRLYAQQSDDRRVSVSSRKGQGFYTIPLGEKQEASNTATDGASTANVSIINGVHAQPFVAVSNDRITRVDISLLNANTGTGSLIVEIWSNDVSNNAPYKLLSTSSIDNGSIDDAASYQTARFNNSPRLIIGQTYWIVLHQQDDATGHYTLTTTTSGNHAFSTNSALSSMVEQNYSINYSIYTTPSNVAKGIYRFNRDNGQNITCVVYDTTLYKVDETTHTLIPVITGLSENASEYRFTNADNKVFFVNSYDDLTWWDGGSESTNPTLLKNGDFATDTSYWSAAYGDSGNAIAYYTSEPSPATPSLHITATSGTRSAWNATPVMNANTKYHIQYWAKGDSATGSLQIYANGAILASSVVPLTTSWTLHDFYYTPTSTTTGLAIQATASNFYIDNIIVKSMSTGKIIDPQLPILSNITFHKDRAWGVVADDPNKLVFSEAPGNPSNANADAQWYNAWLSVSFIYDPRPHNGSPITWIGSFQDSLTVMTQDKKYIISGYDRGSLTLRESTGAKGCLSARGAIADENNIYFVASDGFYIFNGSSDKKISDVISPVFNACADKDKITPVYWSNQIRFYMESQGSSNNDICMIYDKDLQEWMMDTEVYADRAIYYNDANDDGQIVEVSSLCPVLCLGEYDYNNAGAPIDFEYRLKYDSFKVPAQRKRITRYYPILQGVDSTFTLTIGMDKDFENSPTEYPMLLEVNGSLIGNFKFGDGTLLGGSTAFKLQRISISGYAHYWQLRISRRGVNNRVAFVGSQYSYKLKRL